MTTPHIPPPDDIGPASALEQILQAGQELQKAQALEDYKHGGFYGGAAADLVKRSRQWQKDIDDQEERRYP